MRRLLILLSIALMAPAAHAEGDPLAGARALLDGIYSAYVRGEAPSLANIYTAELDAAINRFDGEHDGLGYDPFCQCQDFGSFSYEISSIEPTPEGAVARVAISNFGERGTVTISLAREGGAWRVANIGEGEDRLYVPEAAR